MKTVVVTDSELIETVNRDESQFSNADGGELIIGIRDKKQGKSLAERWEGIADIERLNGHLQALFDVKPALDLKYEFLRWEGGDGYALRVF